MSYYHHHYMTRGAPKSTGHDPDGLKRQSVRHDALRALHDEWSRYIKDNPAPSEAEWSALNDSKDVKMNLVIVGAMDIRQLDFNDPGWQ